jgi:hypothetical protein
VPRAVQPLGHRRAVGLGAHPTIPPDRLHDAGHADATPVRDDLPEPCRTIREGMGAEPVKLIVTAGREGDPAQLGPQSPKVRVDMVHPADNPTCRAATSRSPTRWAQHGHVRHEPRAGVGSASPHPTAVVSRNDTPVRICGLSPGNMHRRDHVLVLRPRHCAAATRYQPPVISRRSAKNARLVGVLIPQLIGTFW